VQGVQSAAQLRAALQLAYDRAEVDVLLLVRGGGALEDLWSFNDEALARLIVQSPVPLVSGVGHETDFTIADFCADVRAATPTAAAELAARPQADWLEGLQVLQDRLQRAQQGRLDQLAQSLDRLAARLGQPSHGVARAQARLGLLEQRLGHAARLLLQRERLGLEALGRQLPQQLGQALARRQSQTDNLATRLGLLDPRLVLKRGYAWLSDEQGRAVTGVAQVQPGQGLKASLADGDLALQVLSGQPQPSA
jgi:exodeoxyribonuclease VII large subunit